MTTDACTLPTTERPVRLAELDALLASARSVERGELEVRMGLTGANGLMAAARDLAEREMACCSFFAFELEGTDDDLTMTVTVPPARRDVLDALAARAVELSA